MNKPSADGRITLQALFSVTVMIGAGVWRQWLVTQNFHVVQRHSYENHLQYYFGTARDNRKHTHMRSVSLPK